jgi:hypothetical protein
MPSSPAERDEYLEYFSGSGAITCRVLCQLGPMVYCQFRTADWPGYRAPGLYSRVALFPEHLRPADPGSPGVVAWVQMLERQRAVQEQQLADRRRRRNGQTSAPIGAQVAAEKNGGPIGPHLSKHRATDNVTKALPATNANGVKPSPKPALAKGRKARANTEDGHSLKPVRSISGLTLTDYISTR